MSRKRTQSGLTNGQNVCGEEIRRRRCAFGISQEKLAELSQLQGWDITRGLIAKVETGERGVSDDELICFAKLLRCTPHELLNWK